MSDGDAGLSSEEAPVEDTFHDARDTFTVETITVGETPRKTSERQMYVYS